MISKAFLRVVVVGLCSVFLTPIMVLGVVLRPLTYLTERGSLRSFRMFLADLEIEGEVLVINILYPTRYNVEWVEGPEPDLDEEP